MFDLIVWCGWGLAMFFLGLFWGARRRDELDEEAANDPVYRNLRLVHSVKDDDDDKHQRQGTGQVSTCRNAGA